MSWWSLPAVALSAAIAVLAHTNNALARERLALGASRARLRRLAVAHDDLRHDSDRVVPEYRAVRRRLVAALRRRRARQ